MRREPTALGYVNDDVSAAASWDLAQCRRLARRLGYRLIWPSSECVLGLVDQVRSADVDAVIVPSAAHLDEPTLDRLMHSCDVETVSPPQTYARYFGGRQGCPA
ncbi:hypothetical protein [Nocardia sp. NBC_01327]|uniref:hypothetical protein n=1 Tax=Nocardia sp. NBC_01327 TaxID=2903593 RepID=UPI002E14C10C|nr:hypothetical protein OG326_15835 [Nocardia sp. NBC_01327]